ncbi:hypothetical protein CATMIT_01640 [Catenibacterium mitsuokai DSM 15897]|nr:hypothetical protein CATMIT_01640 [Catenibacterium mitsuokai DSM 15897]
MRLPCELSLLRSRRRVYGNERPIALLQRRQIQRSVELVLRLLRHRTRHLDQETVAGQADVALHHQAVDAHVALERPAAIGAVDLQEHRRGQETVALLVDAQVAFAALENVTVAAGPGLGEGVDVLVGCEFDAVELVFAVLGDQGHDGEEAEAAQAAENGHYDDGNHVCP